MSFPPTESSEIPCCFQAVVLDKTFESTLDYKEIKPVIPYENKPWIFTGRTEALILDHLMQIATSLGKTLILGKIEGKRRRGQQKMRWLDGIADSMDMDLSKLQETVEDRGDQCPSVHGVTKNQTWLRSWTTTTSRKSWKLQEDEEKTLQDVHDGNKGQRLSERIKKFQQMR